MCTSLFALLLGKAHKQNSKLNRTPSATWNLQSQQHHHRRHSFVYYTKQLNDDEFVMLNVEWARIIQNDCHSNKQHVDNDDVLWISHTKYFLSAALRYLLDFYLVLIYEKKRIPLLSCSPRRRLLWLFVCVRIMECAKKIQEISFTCSTFSGFFPRTYHSLFELSKVWICRKVWSLFMS